MHVIGLCGRAGAGKSTIVSIVKECFPEMPVVSTGDAARQILVDRGIEVSHRNLQEITREILAARGKDFISFVFDHIDRNSSVTLVDALRRVEDVDCINRTYGPPTVMSVFAPEDIRFARLIARARPSDALDRASFKELCSLENEWGIDKLSRLAQIEVINVGTYLELRQQVESKIVNILASANKTS